MVLRYRLAGTIGIACDMRASTSGSRHINWSGDRRHANRAKNNCARLMQRLADGTARIANRAELAKSRLAITALYGR